MNSPPSLVLPLVALTLGALLGGAYALRVFRARVDVAALAAVLHRLLRAGNVDRALKLARVAPEIPHLAAVRAALEVCRQGAPQGEPSSGYRDAGDTAPEYVRRGVRPLYDAAFDGAARPVRLARFAAAPGALLLAGCVFFIIALEWDWHSSEQWILAGAAAFGLLVLAFAARADHRMERGRGQMFEALRGDFEAIARDPTRAASTAQSTSVRVSFEVRQPGHDPWVIGSEEEVIRIGSMASAQVRVEAPGVERMHAVVEASDDALTVIDLGSSAGTRVNGETVNKRDVVDGDVIGIGEVELRVRFNPSR